ncbi:MGH1-like glycoside hydrolase domain-containing protein [Psychromicrobium lacuslunae]|uniref:Glucosidase n=1 Tax=Psychromicrobium lacuslunae TaxID=1618207 RepID=A0A0D4C260_9MICC|nr:glucosidase [Psychromicrobium lacuslunae]AJT42461.1 glucosidase [Psychromicrobium lacuslunae]
MSVERARLSESQQMNDPWRRWGPYLSARQWGTVREDYSADGNAWGYLPFDQAHQRAYRWGEDGLAGLSDDQGILNLSVALWNGQDDRLKERLFGLTNEQGNHGEDVKEYWWPLDATPTHSWAQWLYRYPQAAFPYQELLSANAQRDRQQPEYELSDTGILAENRFFDVVVSHAKASPDDICLTVTATNHGPVAAPLDILPQLWFRNTWAWQQGAQPPQLRRVDAPELEQANLRAVRAEHRLLGRYFLAAEGAPEVLVCDNETDARALFGSENRSAYPKDGVNRAVVHADYTALNPAGTGTKAAFHYHFDAVAPGASVTIKLRLTNDELADAPFGANFDSVVADRRRESDEFYAEVIPDQAAPADALTARRAFAGLLWGKQLYRFNVARWLDGDSDQPTPPTSRRSIRNAAWRNLDLADVISMPDEWEYPWFASWDLAFHTVPLAHIDPDFAKAQLILLCREWAMHPNGQLPAYEWEFSDVNPPVHAWAVWQVYQISGAEDLNFLRRVFAKLLLNFSWWVNRKDADGSNLFEGGFLGMDNISVFDRSKDVPAGFRLEQSDATSWMAFYCLGMLRISLELARTEPGWQDMATKFLEHFLALAEAMDSFGSGGVQLWDEADGFFYDVLVANDGELREPVRVRSMVGLLPMIAVAIAPDWVEQELPEFSARVRWVQRHRPELAEALISSYEQDSGAPRRSLSVLNAARLERLLGRLLDEEEFLSPHGIRSLSAAYREGGTVRLAERELSIRYLPGESDSGLFGGNSNWRGPVWFPVNLLLIDALDDHARGVGSALHPEGKRLSEVAEDLRQRLISLFRPDSRGRRPGQPRDFGDGALWDHPTFSEYFDGDSGIGLGASHQTGWTAVVAHLICRRRP